MRRPGARGQLSGAAAGASTRLRIALFTLESAISDAAVAALLRGPVGERVVLPGRSVPRNPALETWRHLRRLGPRLLPYLAVNYALPRWAGAVRRMAGGGPGTVAAAAAERGIPLRDLAAVNGPVAAATIRAALPDLLLTCHFDQILSAATIALAPLGGINLHPSLLPRHRGPVPTIWALAEDPPAFGVTVHRLVPRIDAGAILAQAAVALPPGTTASAAARALHLAGVPLLERVVAALEAGEAAEREVAPLPYRPFPPAALLRALRRRGGRTVDLRDLWAALRRAAG